MGGQKRICCWAKLGVLALCVLFSWCSPSLGEKAFSTQKALVFYYGEADLDEMDRRLRFIPAENLYQQYFIAWPPSQSPFAPRLAAKIDGLLAKVCCTLGCWPPPQAMPVRIYLLRDGQAVSQTLLAFQGAKKQPVFGYSPLEAFYEPSTHTIFLSLADLHTGIMAHELVHFVLCTALPSPPSAEVQDGWAKFMETRLE